MAGLLLNRLGFFIVGYKSFGRVGISGAFFSLPVVLQAVRRSFMLYTVRSAKHSPASFI